ncbi:MAG TPA: enoyl-ACP reductase FabV [Opitutaceae bacterium]|nr:enoyl-ACP reductase FabV [Opitutaceae bacterium]
MVIKPKVRGFVCVTAHPVGCAANVQEQIDYVKSKGPIANGPKKVLVIGSSTGYGLASRITAAFGSGADTVGVFFDRPSDPDRTATPGWYNTAAFDRAAHAAGLFAKSINGDAFSNDIKQQAIAAVRDGLGKVDLVVYSLASPRRTHPVTGVVHKSVLKPLGAPYSNKTVDTDKGVVSEVTIEPATPEEATDTIAVMGGEDWEMWIRALSEAGLLAPGCTTVAYDYIGPAVTWPIYYKGTIGGAKEHLRKTARSLDAFLKPSGGRAFVSINKALVTQASSAIPVVPLYISILYKLMKAAGTHEGCIEQIQRLFATQLFGGAVPNLDAEGRIRIDDREMRLEIQDAITLIWPQVTTENLGELTDIAGYRAEFLRLFGFGMPGVDYEADVDAHVELPK